MTSPIVSGMVAGAEAKIHIIIRKQKAEREVGIGKAILSKLTAPRGIHPQTSPIVPNQGPSVQMPEPIGGRFSF